MRRVLPLIVASGLVGASASHAQTAADSAAIRQTALDYIEGWYEGNAERMKGALHPELAKRIIMTDAQSGESHLQHMTAEQLVQGTAAGYGTRTPKARQLKGVAILDTPVFSVLPRGPRDRPPP